MKTASKIALVTGGSRGLGRDMALRLADYGNDVLLTYQTRRESAEEVADQIRAKGRKASVLSYDAEKVEDIGAFLQQVRQTLASTWNTDRFDFLINNAGIGATIPFLQVTEQDFDRFLHIHFKSVFFLTQQALALMNDQGRIINVSTGTTRFCVPGYSVYASMKGAIETFTRYLAKEVGSRGITANVVAPGPIETDFNNAAIRNNPERKAHMAAQTALGRVGEARDIGGIVAFLCSPDAGWISGQRIEASGGINL
ncbi:MAG TPA: SDR family oxidoreductase [Chitinophagaceae bacterium]|nr:SDR family oxidoreductase [Chitinophagaceae bacterium]